MVSIKSSTGEQPDLADIVATATDWQLGETGGFVVGLYAGTARYTRKSLSHVEVKTVHPDLPAVLYALLDWNKKNRNHIVNSKVASHVMVLATLALMNNDVIRIKNRKNHENLFFDIHAVELRADTMSDIHIKGRLLRLARNTDYLADKAFVCDVVDTSVWVSKQDLDRQFPGWAVQWAIGRELGLDLAQLSRTVFAKRELAVETPSLTNLHFD